MPIIAGSLSGRVWRVVDSLPAGFTEVFERNLKRHAFKPVNTDRGHLRSIGWVNLRQVLDANLTAKKALFGNALALALRVDRITINQRLFRATFAQELAAELRQSKVKRLSPEQRGALEESIRMKLLKAQPPATAIHEFVWDLQRGLVFFGSTGEKINVEFSELFSETFNVSLEAQYPYLRAERWAKRQRQERDLMEVLPAPFSPNMPAEVIEIPQADEKAERGE